MSGGAEVEALDLDRLEALLPRLADIQHDLGKYVCFEQRFAGADAPVEVLRAALRADLYATRRQGDTTEAAWALWARLRPADLDEDVDVRALDAALAALVQADLDGPPEALAATAALAREVRATCARLHGRARDRLRAAGRDDAST